MLVQVSRDLTLPTRDRAIAAPTRTRRAAAPCEFVYRWPVHIRLGHRLVLGLAAFGGVVVSPSIARAHFVLQAPAANFEQSGLGDPQKAPPCGDNGTAVPTGMVTAYQGGDTITITIDETVYHPGHYRIALAVNDPSELPPEPEVTPGATFDCGSAEIMNPAVFPVLADGVFEHASAFDSPQSIDITLPNDVTCTNCTLQIIQFMSEHGLNNPGGCYYHHCANISITPSAGDTSGGGNDSGDSSGGTASASGTDGTTSATTDASASASASGSASATAGGESTGDATLGGGSGGTGGTDSAGSTDDDGGGCACTSAASRGPASGLVGLLGLFGLVGLRLRTRRR